MADSTAVQRRRLTVPARREQVLDATAAIVAEKGFPAVSIQSVARRAGISRPIVYEHFGGLQGLLETLVKREMGRAVEQIKATKLGDLSEGDPVELMLDSLNAYLAAVQAHPTTWRLVLTPPEGAPELLRKRIARGRGAVLKSIANAVHPGSLPNDQSQDPELTARILSAMADEYASLVLLDPKRFAPERLLVHARWWLSHISA